MQNTLLGLAIAIILALVTALVGPLFIDWGRYRSEFEARASRLTGLDVHVTGAIEARLLPTPTLTLQDIEISRHGEGGSVRAQSLGIEFALSGLMRGEWRAAEVRLRGADFTFGLNGAGRLDWPAPSVSFDPDGISVQRLDIRESRATLTDAASGSKLVLEKLEFDGELRSLAGPVKGEGAFTLAGQHYPYRLAASRPGEDGAVRLRVNIDPIDLPLTADIEASVWLEGGTPKFDGSLQLARPVGRAPEGSSTLIIEPWRISSRIKGDGAGVVLEQVEYQYGPEDRAVKLRGDATLTLGANPQLNGVLSSPQVDIDRLLDLPEATRRRPLAAIKSIADYFAGARRLPIPVKLGVSVETITIAGAVLQRLSGDIRSNADAWEIESLDLRAPGLTQIGLSGRLDATPQGTAFIGRAKVDARDPRAFITWLSGRNDVQAITARALRAEGDVKFAPDSIAVDGLKAELDRMTLEGHLAYSWASGDRPARLDATLSAPEIDVDRAHAVMRGLFADTAFEWPRESVLAIKVGRAFIAGVEARRADVKMQFDGRGLQIERLAIGDFGGAVFNASGRIDMRAQAPRGNVTVELEARRVDGIAALLEKVAPAAADQLRASGRFLPAKLRASLQVESQANGVDVPTTSKFRIEGSAGTFRIDVQGEAGAGAVADDASAIAKFAGLIATKVNVSGRIDAADGTSLLQLIGLDRIVSVDKGGARLSLSANGALNGSMAVESKLAASGLDASASGSLRLTGSQGPTAALDVRVANANLRLSRSASPARSPEVMPAAMTGKLSYSDATLRFTDLAGTIAGTELGGSIDLSLDQPMSINGDLEISAINAPSVVAAMIGTPFSAPNAPWPSDPFEASVLGNLSGQIKIKAVKLALMPKLVAHDVRSIVQFDQDELSIENIQGSIGGGRLAGSVSFHRGADGMTAHSDLRLAGANIAELLPVEGDAVLGGQVTANLNVQGIGRSLGALIGALEGGGTFTLQDGRIAKLDPGAFAAMIRLVDQGLAIDAARIRERMELALAAADLSVPLAEGAITISSGQARLGNMMTKAQGANLDVSASVDLIQSVVNARLTLSGLAATDSSAGRRPEIVVALKGPIDAAKRTLEVDAFSSWLALRAVERQAKRLDALQSGRPADASVPGELSQTGAPPPAPRPRPAAATPAPPAGTGAGQRKANQPSTAPQALPSAEQAAPPVNARPAPVPRTPRNQSGATPSPASGARSSADASVGP